MVDNKETTLYPINKIITVVINCLSFIAMGWQYKNWSDEFTRSEVNKTFEKLHTFLWRTR